MIVGIMHFTDRIGEGIGQPRFDSVGGEELLHVQPGVTIALGRLSPESPGTLYISNRRVMWLSDTDRDKGYAVDFLSISLHAVSRDPETYPSPCIYTQVMRSCLVLWQPIYESLCFDVIMVSSFSDIEVEDAKDDEFEGLDAECPDETYLSKITEMRLVPHDPNQLDTLFDIFCQCVELNPEPLEGDDEENSWIFGEDFSDDGDQPEWHLSEDLANPIGQVNGNPDLAHSVLHLQINDQRFEDAEEMEDANHN